jgi:hypothetical protein
MADTVRQKVSEVRKVEEVIGTNLNDDNLKFAILIGMIEVQQVSNKEVLNTILHLVSLDKNY